MFNRDLDADKKLLAEASDGPWTVNPWGDDYGVLDDAGRYVGGFDSEENAKFAVMARQALGEYINELKAERYRRTVFETGYESVMEELNKLRGGSVVNPYDVIEGLQAIVASGSHGAAKAVSDAMYLIGRLQGQNEMLELRLKHMQEEIVRLTDKKGGCRNG